MDRQTFTFLTFLCLFLSLFRQSHSVDLVLNINAAFIANIFVNKRYECGEIDTEEMKQRTNKIKSARIKVKIVD